MGSRLEKVRTVLTNRYCKGVGSVWYDRNKIGCDYSERVSV